MKEYSYGCKHAYFTPQCRHVLCDKEGEPDFKDKTSVAHALCGHQPFCPNARVCALRPTWTSCEKLSVHVAAAIQAVTPKKRSKKKD